MKRVLLLTVLLVVLSACAMAISVYPGIIYTSNNVTTSGNYVGVGIPFYVPGAFYFEDLGAYAHNSSLGGVVNVGVFTWDPNAVGTSTLGTTGLVTAVSVDSSSPTAFGSAWAEVNGGSGVTLSQGWYLLYAQVANPLNPTFYPFNYAPSITTNTFSGTISYGYQLNGRYYQVVAQVINQGFGPSLAYTWLSNDAAAVWIPGPAISVPEPSTYALMASVGLALYFLRRRRNQAAKN